MQLLCSPISAATPIIGSFTRASFFLESSLYAVTHDLSDICTMKLKKDEKLPQK